VAEVAGDLGEGRAGGAVGVSVGGDDAFVEASNELGRGLRSTNRAGCPARRGFVRALKGGVVDVGLLKAARSEAPCAQRRFFHIAGRDHSGIQVDYQTDRYTLDYDEPAKPGSTITPFSIGGLL
jgi:hypothetical protein